MAVVLIISCCYISLPVDTDRSLDIKSVSIGRRGCIDKEMMALVGIAFYCIDTNRSLEVVGRVLVCIVRAS